MAQNILDLLRGYLVHYGYWAVAAALLLENAGLPVPGETVLLLASFLAYSEGELHLPYIVLIGICAATLGDIRVPGRVLTKGERLFQRYGAAAIFFARFIFGMRIIAGPLAGVLRMPWRKFVAFNLMGAALWVTVISTVGYLFGRHWDLLTHYLEQADIAIALIVVVMLVVWWRKRQQTEAPGKE